MSERKCLKCGTVNPGGAAYCNECGALLEETAVICFKCGEKNSAKAKFCMNCGSKLEVVGVVGIQQTEHPEGNENEQETSLSLTKGNPISTNTDETYEQEKKGAALSGDLEDPQPKTDSLHMEREHDVTNRESGRKKKTLKSGKKKIVGIAAAIVVVILIISSFFRLPAIESIKASYDGETAAGTILDETNEGIKVTGFDKEGTEHDITSWTIEKPQTLEMDSSATVTIAYKELTSDLTVECSTSELAEITASYSGDASAGVVLDSDNSGFTVTAHYKNGGEEVVDGWTIEEPATLAADTTSSVVIKYENKETTLDVICTTVTIDKITAKYSGSTKAGVKVGEGSKDVTVTAHYKNGDQQEVTGWTVEKPVTLKEGETSKLKIHYGEYDCILKIECTDLSKKQYKSKCKSYTYNEIARDPDDYEGKKAKFSGEVVQALESPDSVQVDMRVAVDGDYDQMLYVVYYKPEGSSRILENDHISVYGELGGVYTYTSTMNAQITIPIIYAQYID